MKALACLIGLLVFVPLSQAQAPPNVITSTPYRCTSSVNINLLKITVDAPSSDALQLGTNCTGSIARVEIEGRMADGIKVQNASANAAHDLVIGGGYVRCGQAASGVHQDGMQAMGGRNITFRNLVIDCLGGGGGNYFPARGGSGATMPTDIVCIHCAFGPRHPNNVQIQTSVRSGIRDSLVCRPTSGRAPITIGSTAQQPVNASNTIVPSNDPVCTPDGLLAWVGNTTPPDPPDPPDPPTAPAPQLSVCANFATNFTVCWPRLSGVVRYNFYVDGQAVSHSLNGSLERVRFAKQVGTHRYGVGAVQADGREGRSEVTITR